MVKYLNISIVLYNSEFDQIIDIVEELKKNEAVNQIYLIDNSPIRNVAFENCDTNYMFIGRNLGYGSGHNLAINYSINEGVKYHLVLNADISFGKSVLDELISKMDNDLEIGLIMPKVQNIDGSLQILPKRLPTPFNLIIRVFPPLRKIFHDKNKEYTLENYQDLELNVPIISGCFSLFRVDALKDVGLYDDKFFMYFEDFDISRRIHTKYKTLYFPKVSVIHAHERGAAKNYKLFKVFVKSAIIYFNKYGWFFDKERKLINKEVFKQLK